MKLDRLTQVAEIFAALGVIVTLLLLVSEVRTNTRAVEHEAFARRSEHVYGPFLDPAELRIVLGKIQAVDGLDASVEALYEHYDLTVDEAILWSRHLGLIWRDMEGDFVYNGPSDRLEGVVRGLLESEDNQVYWGAVESSFAPEFTAYVRTVSQR